MNRNDFLNELRQALEPFPLEERESAIAYYEEYLEEEKRAEQKIVDGIVSYQYANLDNNM